MKSFLKRMSEVLGSADKSAADDEKANEGQSQAATSSSECASETPESTKSESTQSMTSGEHPPQQMANPTPQKKQASGKSKAGKVQKTQKTQKGKATTSSQENASERKVPLVCLFFEVHQPNRLREYTFFDIGNSPFYEDDDLNQRLLDEACELSYLPANRMFQKLIEESDGELKLSLSLSGVLIEQLEAFRPDVLKSFQDLYATGAVEILAETYYHSMGFHSSQKDFAEQVALQMAKVKEVFGATPKAFRHTACVYYNELAAFVESLGFESMLGDAVGSVLQGREANRLYRSPNVKKMKTLLRNGGMSDDLAVRFGTHEWDEHPLTAQKFARWCAQSDGEVVNLFMDYDCIGRHQTKETGIFEFWKAFPGELKKLGGRFATVSEVAASLEVAGEYDCHLPTSWNGKARDLSAWKANAMQEEARRKILMIEKQVKAENNPEMLHQWRKMQTAEHFLYMSTKTGPEGELHDKLRPYKSAYDAYLFFMNALSDLQLRLGTEE